MAGRSSDDGTDDRGPSTDSEGPAVDDPGKPDDHEADGDHRGEAADGDTQDEDDMGGVFGPMDEARSIEPGDPSLEHALFVLLGVLTGVASTLALLGIV